ncbi:hypothetical protein H634G_05359 [Metarhizium anisopliae BRIP 53293]|uniref:Uncharacterized protein n=1 Tax=Metarhizium anisopliae BRIP 53293 TaxID=1291518 RepID=A0A0D9P0E6_METAN|nr:hypothetical protein H634G_05359 [Metarhizium anisopliae BRIP 53293]
MQRGTYGQSPPLHHPVPQHVSTVPQLRSPPPPPGSAQSMGQTYGGASTPYQQQGGNSGNVFGAYGQFMNDPTAQVAAQFGQTAFKHGQEYVEQNIGRYVNVSALKHYFNVSNSYVVNKLFLVLFPWRHKPWARKQATGASGQEGWYLPPREDVNSPDMYIPVMALVTYILLSTLIAGLKGQFKPELLGYTATTGMVVVIVEIVALKLGCYLLSISSQSQLLDLIAYSGYKFVGIIVTIVVAEILNGGKGTGGWIGWGVFLYTFLANSLFLMRSLRYVLLPETSSNTGGPMQTDSRAKRNQRTQFLFFYSYITAIEVDWIPVFQFLMFSIISTPSNFLWQDFLESSFPARLPPAGQGKAAPAVDEQPLSIRNTLLKFGLDQTVGATFNTLLFSVYIHSIHLAMPDAPRITNFTKATSYWISPGVIDFSAVDMAVVWQAALAEFWTIVVAGMKLWPAVSLVNFTLVKTVEGRNLVGCVAGLGWGIYMSMIAAKE